MLGKNRRKQVRKKVFYNHTNIVTKKWGVKNAPKFFYRNARTVRAKNMGKKIVVKKVRKNVFYIHTNMVTKNGGKNARKFLQKHTNSASKKCWEKNCRQKCEKSFFIITRISLPKIGGTKRAKLFLQ